MKPLVLDDVPARAVKPSQAGQLDALRRDFDTWQNVTVGADFPAGERDEGSLRKPKGIRCDPH